MQISIANPDRPDDLHCQLKITIPADLQVILTCVQQRKQNLAALDGLHREDYHPAAIR